MRFSIQNLFAALAPAAPRGQCRTAAGFSLIEVLLIVAMLSITILPFTVLMSQTAGNARGAYLQSSRSILMNSIMDEANVDRDYFVQSYSNALVSTVTESGQALPYRRVVDTAASSVFEKVVYFYLYNNAADAANAPRYKTRINFKRDVMRVRFNNPASRLGWVDASGQWWEPSNNYDAANLVPGLMVVPTGYGDNTSIVNLPSHPDAEMYQYGVVRTAAAFNYNANVSNGLYTVKLYFVENNQPGRLMDITIEGKLMNPGNPSNAYLRCGNRYYCGNVQMFDVMVSDGVLNIQVSAASAATHTSSFINAITIIKRT
ncbi:malectin domain-containing carbohydrate-binding protein [Vampirovibrio sp.]|uniref:malectin domain-containing carbohydrate-binding protein n=1 Tax=Vampirovibrio sp. TaxID=2717857 RepID=UPI0035936AB7